MKTIADFKRKMIVGAKVKSCLYRFKNGEYSVADRHDIREVSIVQSNSFALKTWSTSKNIYIDSWCRWPAKNEFYPVSPDTIEIRFQDGHGKLVYTFV